MGAASPRVVLQPGRGMHSQLPFSLQKLQLVLAPFHNLMLPEDVGADPISRLSHSLQQLDRIDSLSEQISFLEERLETCKCLEEEVGKDLHGEQMWAREISNTYATANLDLPPAQQPVINKG